MALAFGIIGIGGGILSPFIGLAFGAVGIVLATSSYRLAHGWLRLAGLILPLLAVLISIGFWVSAVSHSNQLSKLSKQAGTSNGITTLSVTTPCYTMSFKSQLNVNNNSGSCTMNAYNGTTFQQSTNVFKVVANQTNTVNLNNFDSFSKSAIEADISKNLPGFNITNQSSDIFDGSPAYYIQAYNLSSNVAVIEETVLHLSDSSNKDNFFDIVHATNGQSVSLTSVEESWQWNN
jgi:hypothetical protein